MNKKGWYILQRGWMDHPFLSSGWNQPFSRREAWVWLIEAAAWDDHDTIYRGIRVSLKRGDVLATVRYLMDTWRWSQGKVVRYINDLANEHMIEKKTDTGFCIISLCNYERFQNPLEKSGTPTDMATDMATDMQTDININNIKKIKNINNITPTPLSDELFELTPDNPPAEKLIEDQFLQFWKYYPRKISKKKSKEAFIRATARTSSDVIIAAARQYGYDCAGKDEQYIKLAATWLNGDCWEDYEQTDNDFDHDDLSESKRQRLIASKLFKNAGEL